MSFRVLVFYVTNDSGHFKAAEAIKYVLKKYYPSDINVYSLDCFNYTNPVLSKVIYHSYFSLIKTKPEVWGYLYDNPKVVEKINKFKDLMHKYNSNKLESIIREYDPHVIVCTQAFPCGLVANYKSSNNKNVPLIGVLTDYYAHSFWLYDQVDAYIVASEEAKERLTKEGIGKEKVFNYGIPILPSFFHRKNKLEIYKKIQLNPKLPTVFIMSGSRGMGPLKDIIFSLNKINLDFQILVTAGVNASLKKYLSEKINNFKHPIKIYGYIDNVDEIMQAVDILITKPGGLTTAEAIACELPMVIFNAISGQEKNNAKYLISRNLALEAETHKDVRSKVEKLLKDKKAYMDIKRNLSKQNVFNPSRKIADLIYNFATMQIKV